jgi:hypothetical protein
LVVKLIGSIDSDDRSCLGGNIIIEGVSLNLVDCLYLIIFELLRIELAYNIFFGRNKIDVNTSSCFWGKVGYKWIAKNRIYFLLLQSKYFFNFYFWNISINILLNYIVNFKRSYSLCINSSSFLSRIFKKKIIF